MITPKLNDTEISIKKKKQQEFKFLGSSKRKRGQFLFAYDPDKNLVYKVDVVIRKEFNPFEKKEVGQYKVVLDPRHKMLWSINHKNATRKFLKS